MSQQIIRSLISLILIVAILVSGYLIFFSKYDRYFLTAFRQYTPVRLSCAYSVLSSGRFAKYDTWEPHGCTLHNYSIQDAGGCVRQGNKKGLRRNHVVFIGDSRIRSMFDEFNTFFNKTEKPLKSHTHQTYSTNTTEDMLVEFFWGGIVSELKASLQAVLFLHGNKLPVFIIAGLAAHCSYHGNASPEALENYKAGLKALQPILTELQNKTTLIWMIQPRLNETAFHITYPKYMMVTNQEIDLYNNATKEILQAGPFQIWSTARAVAEGFFEDMKDGIHVGQRTNHWNVQLLLNFFCNEVMTESTATCCKPAKKDE